MTARRARRAITGSGAWSVATFGIAFLCLLPILALIAIAFSGDASSLMGVATSVLPRASLTTLIVLGGLAIVSGTMGAISAWLVSFYDFPGRKTLSWALMLPLAVPTYISAYAFSEFFAFTGPVQSLVRQIGGFELARDYWFPEIRSVPGAIFILSFVLYPYVYLSVRTLFGLQGRRAVEAAHSLGAGPYRALTSVLLPLARPALALGVTLAMMEAINDIGAMQFLGVQTLTYSVFSVWLNQNDLAGAAQIALVLLLVVFALIGLERLARRQQNYVTGPAPAKEAFRRQRLTGAKSALAFAAVSFPVALGFGIPMVVLSTYALRYLDHGFDSRLIGAVSTSVGLATIAALATLIAALVLTYTVRIHNTRLVRRTVRSASIGYAIPGTIIALGLFLPLARFDNLLDGAMRDWFGLSTGLLLTGSGATLIYAYLVRFMAMAEGTLDGAFEKLSPSLDQAAMVGGYSRISVLTRILAPLMRPALFSAALLVFIETLKELSATMMLRPFGIETLAIYVHDLATRGRIEQGASAALLIVMAGMIPVLLLNRASSRSD